MKLVGKNTQEGAGAMQRLLDNVDQNLLLAEHAKTWEWQETGDHVLTVKEEAPANKLLRLWRHQAICAAEPVNLKVAKPSV
jgi:hypothetical protein